ncbi:MAG: DUF2029 domain-containing protein [Alphaproteobacteria bacterium]|nr:DUF2029 domain-containing protein [Alphaproteobacteria bacterium]
MNSRYPAISANLGLWSGRVWPVVLAALLGTLAVFYFWYGLPGQTPALNDFGSFWASGAAALEGRNPYGVYPETFHIEGTDIVHPNLNPPASLLLFAPLSLMDPHLTMKLIWWSGLLAYLAIVVAAARGVSDSSAVLPVSMWALALPAFWDSLRLGQIYVLLLFVVACAWFLLRRQRLAAAGILIGIFVALKPIFVLWPLMLFVTGHLRASAWAGLAFAAVSLMPLLVFGPDVYGQWLDLVLSEAGNRKAAFPNATVMAIGYRAGSPVIGMLLPALVLVWAALRIRQEHLSLAEASAIGIALGIAISPVAWFHYLLFLLPAMLSRRWSAGLLAGAAIMVLPVALLHVVYEQLPALYPALAEPIRATAGSPFSWATLFLLGALGRGSR